MSSVTLFISLLCLSLHRTGVERMHICTYLCHAHAYSFALRLSFPFTTVGPLVSCKSCVFPFHEMSSHGCRLTWRLDDLVFYYVTHGVVAEIEERIGIAMSWTLVQGEEVGAGSGTVCWHRMECKWHRTGLRGAPRWMRWSSGKTENG